MRYDISNRKKEDEYSCNRLVSGEWKYHFRRKILTGNHMFKDHSMVTSKKKIFHLYFPRFSSFGYPSDSISVDLSAPSWNAITVRKTLVVCSHHNDLIARGVLALAQS